MNPHVLLVEDNDGDIMLTEEALAETKTAVQLSVVKDGKAAIDFVNQTGSYADVPLPVLILLDINLPKKNGHEVLQYIKRKETIKHIPVIILTTSGAQRDINLAYQNYVNCYIVKPIDVERFTFIIASVVQFWLSIVALPMRKIAMDENRQ